MENVKQLRLFYPLKRRGSRKLFSIFVHFIHENDKFSNKKGVPTPTHPSGSATAEAFIYTNGLARGRCDREINYQLDTGLRFKVKYVMYCGFLPGYVWMSDQCSTCITYAENPIPTKKA